MTDLPTDFEDGVGDVTDAAYFNALGAAVNANTAALAALIPFAAPPGSGWSSINLGGDTAAADDDDQLLTLASNASMSWRLRVRTLTPSSNYTATFWLSPTFLPGGVHRSGIVLRNSTSGLFTALTTGYDSSLGYFMGASTWSSPTNAVSNYRVSAYPRTPNWLRFRDNGTTRYYEFSHDGLDWVTFHSVARTNYVTPDQIGFGAFNYGGGQTGFLRCRSLDGVS